MINIERVKELTEHHKTNCEEYRKIIDGMFPREVTCFEDAPYMYVSLFKEMDLLSIPRDKVHRTLTSSGTSGRQSKIFIDVQSAIEQSKTLASIFVDRFGSKRRKTYVLSDLADESFSARAAAVIGFSALGKKPERLYDVHNASEKGCLAVGMTSDIWAHRSLWYKLEGLDPIVLHGGGWKRLESDRVGREEFNREVKVRTQGGTAVNWFGMIEHSGVVYFDCSEGNFHAHAHGTFICRDQETLEPAEKGMLQFFSGLPTSYPGHVILTDDIGEIVRSCPCGNEAKAFRFVSRRAGAQARGCANV